ncbi:glycosyltransferase family 2 protein [Garciella nitratireducens]|uniref:Glycosyl transferase family 2 n=1 Tax=Garciella nitratireducens DSM 15102 TaxID=1121911 RepID=A0A1T4JU42_9FIRM|nr:glycosyltransferase family 2 protein [Garciella nitratireducens]RBP45569.1 glycosyl transferase family 2 [Garciella nitratireducens]SJZ33625.1 Glycosyl transferase family 2 [Garciella nitratireducens DSM 15102]
MKDKFVSILIPAFNEEKRIGNTLKPLIDSDLIDEIIVIDDGSLDHTAKKARDYGVIVSRLEKNMGKGWALQHGIKQAKGNIIGFLDGDVEESSIEIEKLIQPIIDEQCDVTIAKFPPSTKKGGFGFVKKLAQKGIYFYTKKQISSSLSGQRVFKREVLENIGFPIGGYGVEVDMTIDILKKGYKISEVPVNMKHAETGRDLEGFKHRGKQFLDIFYVLLKRLVRRK